MSKKRKSGYGIQSPKAISHYVLLSHDFVSSDEPVMTMLTAWRKEDLKKKMPDDFPHEVRNDLRSTEPVRVGFAGQSEGDVLAL